MLLDESEGDERERDEKEREHVRFLAPPLRARVAHELFAHNSGSGEGIGKGKDMCVLAIMVENPGICEKMI